MIPLPNVLTKHARRHLGLTAPPFMFKQDKRLQRWYQRYNKKYFDNSLPSTVDVGWDLEEPDAARTDAIVFKQEEDGIAMTMACIRLDPKKHIGSTDARFSLLHEMCHLKLAPWAHHGKKFNNEMRRLAMLGAFDDLW